MRINLVIAPYRDAYFYHEYGSAVRDLQFLETLAKLDDIESITVLNRPVSILERILFKKTLPKSINIPKVNVFDCTSGDVFGAIKGRSWADDVYAKVINNHLVNQKSEQCINVFLDFLPIGSFKATNLDSWLYWYDFIDNFKKHNRFTKKEKQLVEAKYSFVSKNADFISAVSNVCLDVNGPYLAKSTSVITNKVFNSSAKATLAPCTKVKQYDFGFIGFVTNKMDISFIKLIAEQYSIAIFGQAMDKNIAKELSCINNVYLFGKFKYKDVAGICLQFKVGLLPYLFEKSHDGSPLKLYEYMKYNIPCLTSIDYEIEDDRFIRNYNKTNDLHLDIRDMLAISGNDLISDAIKEEWKLEKSMADAIKQIRDIIK
jgi:glycosyltransferase involved in cell wall biosynthesis